MPNWIRNIISFESNDMGVLNKIKDFVDNMEFTKIIRSKDYNTLNIVSGGTSINAYKLYISLVKNEMVDFNIYKSFLELPLKDPKDINDVFGRCNEDLSYLYNNDNNELGFKEQMPKCRGDYLMLGRIQYINLLKYGAKDWYDFNNLYQGTKWGASDLKYSEFTDKGISMIKYEFNTAWDYPCGAYNERAICM